MINDGCVDSQQNLHIRCMVRSVRSTSTQAGARIQSVATSDTDETVVVHWWYDAGRACRYRIGYMVQGIGCSL